MTEAFGGQVTIKLDIDKFRVLVFINAHVWN